MASPEAPKIGLEDSSSLRSAITSTKEILTNPDSSVLPNLDNASKTQKAKSRLFLLSLLSAAIIFAYICGFSLLQFEFSAVRIGLLLLLCTAMMYLVGGMGIDWWELVWGYWWLTMPLAGAAVLVLIRAQEGSNEIIEVD